MDPSDAIESAVSNLIESQDVDCQIHDEPSTNKENIDASVDLSGSPFHGFSTPPTTVKVTSKFETFREFKINY